MSTSPTENYERLLAAAELSESERWRLLSAERRRIVCDVLVDEGTPIQFGELAAAVAARETAPPDPDAADNVAVALHHIHLPKLTDAGIIDYDPDTRQVGTSQTDLGQLTR